jgi:hypothetical protein
MHWVAYKDQSRSWHVEIPYLKQRCINGIHMFKSVHYLMSMTPEVVKSLPMFCLV